MISVAVRRGEALGVQHLLRLVLEGGVRDDQEAARRGGGPQGGQNLLGPVGVGDEVHHPGQQDAHRPAEVDQPELSGLGEDPLRLTQVGVDDPGQLVAGQQLPAVRDRHRVDVDVHHSGLGVHPLRHLVHVAHGGNSGADVEELVDAGVEQHPDGPAQELPAGAHGGGEIRASCWRSARPAAGRSRSCAPRPGSSRTPGPRSAWSDRSRSAVRPASACSPVHRRGAGQHRRRGAQRARVGTGRPAGRVVWTTLGG